MRPATLFVVGIALLSCRQGTSEGDAPRQAEDERSASAIAALPACTGLPAPESDWARVELGPFSLQLPRDYIQRDVQGIDSHVGRFDAEGRTLGFDFGRYSNPLTPVEPARYRAYRACREVIGGRVARLVTARRDSLYFAGAAWRELEQAAMGATHLTITVESRDSTGQTEAVQILRSVRFP